MGESEDIAIGATVVAEALKQQRVELVFGVVGVPVVELAMALQEAGVRYVGMRNEQAASYAASVVGYLTGRPAACLVVPGPGLIHALAGVSNANVNCWPLLVLAGGYDQDQAGMGAFQEWPQVEACRQYVKYAVRLEDIVSAPFHIEKAVRCSLFGRPGPSYIEIPGNLITASVPSSRIRHVVCCPESPLSLADPQEVGVAAASLGAAKRPLVIIGKGVAHARAEVEVGRLVVSHCLPFLATPMGKGVIPDDHPLSVAAARSKALKEADVILLLGARLNWILHFGLPPRFKPDVKVIQVDVCAEELSNNVSAHVMLNGHLKSVAEQLNAELDRGKGFLCDRSGPWWVGLREKVQANTASIKELSQDTTLPMSFYCAYRVINSFLPRNAIIVNEGSQTMDIGRTVLMSHLPRCRLDAGTFATMGVGCGYAVAASLVESGKPEGERLPVVCIQGDSAFGFSGMELETAARYQLPVIFLVMNNNGIFRGLDQEAWDELPSDDTPTLTIPPTSLLPGTRYDKFAAAVACEGYNAASPQQLHTALLQAFRPGRTTPIVVNIVIDPSSARKAQESSWLTRSNL